MICPTNWWALLFAVKEEKFQIVFSSGNEALESQFPTLQTFWESVESLSRNRDPNLIQNEHVYAVCCRPDVAGDVISGENIQTIECYALSMLC